MFSEMEWKSLWTITRNVTITLCTCNDFIDAWKILVVWMTHAARQNVNANKSYVSDWVIELTSYENLKVLRIQIIWRGFGEDDNDKEIIDAQVGRPMIMWLHCESVNNTRAIWQTNKITNSIQTRNSGGIVWTSSWCIRFGSWTVRFVPVVTFLSNKLRSIPPMNFYHKSQDATLPTLSMCGKTGSRELSCMAFTVAEIKSDDDLEKWNLLPTKADGDIERIVARKK